MRILVLDEEFPYPLNTGKHIRSFQLIKRLSAHHEVHYLAYGEHNSESFRVLAETGMRPRPVRPAIPAKSGLQFYGRLFLNLFSRHPYIVSSHYSRAYQVAVDQAIDEIHPDLVLCEWTPYAQFVGSHRGTPAVISAHNIEADIWQDYGKHEKSPFKKWYIRRQWRKVERFEKVAFRSVHGAIAVSDADARQIARIAGDIAVCVVENGVELSYFDPQEGCEENLRLVFTGSMDWRPNQDAALYFVREIFPRLKSRYVGVEAFFVGRNPPPRILELGRIPGITVTGTVDDVRPFIRQAAVYIVPLRIGGGSRLKILEALAMKKPVVSTSLGAQGLAVTHEKEVLLADTPDGFVAEVTRLLEDRQLRVRLGQAGWALVQQRYGWDVQAEKLLRFVSGFGE